MRATTENRGVVGALVLGLVLATACSRGTRIVAGPTLPAPTPTVLARGEPAPKILVSISAVRGASGPSGAFRPGDVVTVDYRIQKEGGAAWRLDEIGIGRALLSGPTFNYQRVVAERTDVLARSRTNADGTHSYTFEEVLPAAFLPPLHDSPSFGVLDGELAGLSLLDGTYTVALAFAWDYTVESVPYRVSGDATFDLRVGDSAVAAPRRVTAQENCARCHVDLRVHDGLWGDVATCLLCHTSGAEDANIPSVQSGTPGVSIDARVLFHKLHNGAHLQTVLGIGFDANGEMEYTSTPRRYVTTDSEGGVHDWSTTGFPAWPNRSIPMPPSFGYGALSAAAKEQDDRMRMGVTSCAACHGDPDGAGPLGEPAQGDIAYAQPSRRACGACHDAVDFTRSTVINQQEMPPQLDDSLCNTCHLVEGFLFGVRDVHRHPLLDTIFEPHAPFETAFNTGVNIGLEDLGEASGGDADGTLDPGEAPFVRFTIQNDAGNPLSAASLGTLRAVIAGPTANSNLVLDVDVPRARFTGAQPYASTLPERVLLEFVGRSTAVGGESFTTTRSPHWNVTGALTRVRVRTGASGVASATTSAAPALGNFLDVLDASGFARDDYVVIAEGVAGEEEYLRVQYVDGDRLWFSSPASPAYASGLRHAHPSGTSVLVVVLVDKSIGVDYALDPSTGTITEVGEFGDGHAVLVDSVTDFRLPAVYPQAHNGSSDLDDTWGKWTGKSLVAGTYRLALSATVDKTHFGPGVQRVYTIGSPPAIREFLVGSASSSEPYALVDSGSACTACHQELFFHGGRSRGFDNCITCHANAGSEDRPRYVAANAPETSGVTVNFRTLLHQIHRGADLAEAATFTAVDAGPRAYPDNFSAETFEHVRFPALPGRTERCAKCHGAANVAWQEPAQREHPTEQVAPVRAWRAVCLACHDDAPALSHAATHVAPDGSEACEVCHGVRSTYAVSLYHEAR